MGQTLTHGVYLPDEGERNCYSGLAANWQILDTSVGTIAEHTSALASKAPAVHTHTKSDITDFPAYGNAAGTICEGNDSRLSDARTPVAHTHTKSDVTDLLNSNFIPSANNSYDLGSSSYQWNNVYSKGYYYNGTAWGLDKYNQWTEVNDFNDLIGLNGAELWFKNIQIEDITANPTSAVGKSVVQIWNKGTTQYTGGIIDSLDTAGTHVFEIVNFGYPLNSTNAYQHRFRFASKRDGTASFYPTYPNVDLGTSTNKWKTLNGVNPGALSLPSGVRQSILEYITDVNLGWGNQITAVRDGYIIVTITDAAGNSIYLFNNTKQYSNGSYGNGSQGTGRLTCMFPVNEGDVVNIFIKAAALSDVFSAYLYVMNGNVNALPSS